ncbi:hypothetical protein [Jatrophihabitans sp.]|uniref:hypothetical protein n=1 Tax=Jatrophihabitans sp. TaxID=1932789 RepID=UPI002CFB44BB|nr:hypothetical protein [Jatrophihabitans sp.]
MPGESARSLRAATLGVAALGLLLLSVPASLLAGSGSVFPTLRPVAQDLPVVAFDATGRLLASPARLRPGASADLVVSGFGAGEPVRLRRSADGGTVWTGRADRHGLVRYRFTVPASSSGSQSLTVLGSIGHGGLPPHRAVFAYLVSAGRTAR